MFIRKKPNSSGKVSVQVIDKSSGRYKVVYTAGSSDNSFEINQLVIKAQAWIKSNQGSLELDFTNYSNQAQQVLDNIESIHRKGYELLLGRLFDQIGFAQITDPIFRELVIARIAFPKSKLKTTQYLYRYQQIQWSEDQVYRYLDKLYDSQKEKVAAISFEHTTKVLEGDIGVVFYDVTTLYFEIDKEDELRKTGFSKEGKHQHPQIVLGLLVSQGGYPLAYEIFEGNKFEGHTMLPVIEHFKKKYHLGQLVIIADSGLLSSANIQELQAKDYKFILGARIKSEAVNVKKEILALKLINGESAVINKGDLKLIITYSKDRAQKDRYNREKGLRRLERLIKNGRLTKANINNRGYNKFLKLQGEINVAIDEQKLAQDQLWDGLKGYITNAQLSNDQVIENYQQLWQIEKAFRIAKSELKVRPIYHRLQRRIEAHICISFVAYKIYKELERQLKLNNAKISATTAIEIAENIFEITVKVPKSGTKLTKLLLTTREQKYLAEIFDFISNH